MEINIIREIFYVTVLLFIIFCGVTLWLYCRYKNKLAALKEYEININATINESIPALLDMIVEECFNEYIVLNVAYKNIDYINSEIEQEIMKGVGEMVSQRISSALLSKFSLYYNLKAISNIISGKIYLMVMDYVIETNEAKE